MTFKLIQIIDFTSQEAAVLFSWISVYQVAG
jgi:hypothetical protein